jgi:hypothetical protein
MQETTRQVTRQQAQSDVAGVVMEAGVGVGVGSGGTYRWGRLGRRAREKV